MLPSPIDAYLLGYRIGRQVELAYWVALADDARAANPLPRGNREEKVRERIALFEACARKLAEAMGRPAGWRYEGGAVDWVTGQPIRACVRRAAA